MRQAVFYLFLVAFLIALGGTLAIPGSYWKLLIESQPWQIALHAYSLLLAFCAVLMAYWVAVDENEIDALYRDIKRLKERVETLETLEQNP